jgi:hypothetical protein
VNYKLYKEWMGKLGNLPLLKTLDPHVEGTDLMSYDESKAFGRPVV